MHTFKTDYSKGKSMTSIKDQQQKSNSQNPIPQWRQKRLLEKSQSTIKEDT
jgi:hypothetical protein